MKYGTSEFRACVRPRSSLDFPFESVREESGDF